MDQVQRVSKMISGQNDRPFAIIFIILELILKRYILPEKATIL
jgi:hypothetical protein